MVNIFRNSVLNHNTWIACDGLSLDPRVSKMDNSIWQIQNVYPCFVVSRYNDVNAEGHFGSVFSLRTPEQQGQDWYTIITKFFERANWPAGKPKKWGVNWRGFDKDIRREDDVLGKVTYSWDPQQRVWGLWYKNAKDNFPKQFIREVAGVKAKLQTLPADISHVPSIVQLDEEFYFEMEQFGWRDGSSNPWGGLGAWQQARKDPRYNDPNYLISSEYGKHTVKFYDELPTLNREFDDKTPIRLAKDTYMAYAPYQSEYAKWGMIYWWAFNDLLWSCIYSPILAAWPTVKCGNFETTIPCNRATPLHRGPNQFYNYQGKVNAGQSPTFWNPAYYGGPGGHKYVGKRESLAFLDSDSDNRYPTRDKWAKFFGYTPTGSATGYRQDYQLMQYIAALQAREFKVAYPSKEMVIEYDYDTVATGYEGRDPADLSYYADCVGDMIKAVAHNSTASMVFFDDGPDYADRVAALKRTLLRIYK